MIKRASCGADEEFYKVLREGRHRKLKGIPRKLVPSPIPYNIISSSLISYECGFVRTYTLAFFPCQWENTFQVRQPEKPFLR